MNYTRSILSSPFPHSYFDLGKQGIVEWRIGEEGSTINEAFLKRLKKEGKKNPKLYSALDTKGSFFKENPFLSPSLFIFHLSRCGSSYASHYFATNPENRVFYEPYFLIQFARTHWDSTSENTDKLKHAIQLLGCGALPEQKRLIIKTTSNFIQKFKEIHSIFPEVPKVFIYRDPKEVLISLLEGPPTYLPSLKDGEKELLLASIENLENVFQHAIDNKAHFHSFINYTNLKEEIVSLEKQFKWDNTSEYRSEQLNLINSRDSKDFGKTFSPDTKEKQEKWKEIQKKYLISIQKLENQFKTIESY